MKTNNKKPYVYHDILLALVYLIIAVLWIIFSENLLQMKGCSHVSICPSF